MTTFTLLMRPYLEKTLLKSLSVVYKLSPNTPRHFPSGGLSWKQKIAKLLLEKQLVSIVADNA